MTIPIEDRISNTTLHFYFANIKRFYIYCLAQRYIDVNPTDFITIKTESNSQQEREPFTKDEVRQLFKMFDNNSSIWYFDLIKTINSYRVVPLHKDLVDMRIPDRLNESLNQYKQDFIQKKFNNVIKIKITDSDKKVMYSLRHTLATQLKYLKVDSLVISEILGHNHGNDYDKICFKISSRYFKRSYR